MQRPDLLPLSALQVEADSPPDVLIDALAFAAFVSGDQPELHALRSALGPIDGRAEPAPVGQYL